MRGARPPLLLAGSVSLTFALGCACGASAYSYDCEDDEYEAWGNCIPLDCGGDNPFGSFSGADVVFVHADSDEKFQHGTEEDPFRTLGRGIAEAVGTGGRHVVVGIGTYSEQITLDARHAGLQIVGICGEEVLVEGLGAAAVVLEGDADTDVHLESLTLRHDDAWGAAVLQGVLSMTDVTVEETVGVGIAALGTDAVLELTDVRVRSTFADEFQGFGLALTEGATATATRLTIEASETAAIYASDEGSSLVLLGATIEGQLPEVEDEQGRGAGMLFYDGASATVFDAAISDVWDVGFEIAGDANATLERTSIVGVHAGGNAGTRLGTGASAFDGASLTLRESSVEGMALYGVVASGPGTEVTLDDSLVGHAAPDPGVPSAGIGLVVVDGAVIDGVDLVVDRAAAVGGLAEGATLRLTDSEVIDTQASADHPYGTGLGGQRGGVLDLFRVSVSGSDTIGVLLDSAEGALVEVDVVDTVRGPAQTTAVGVAAQGTSTLEATGLMVVATQGPGLLVSGGSDATCAGCTLQDNSFAGLLVADEADVEIDGGTMQGTVVDAGQGGGTGVHVQGAGVGARLVLADCEVSDNAHAAVHVVGPADVQLDDNQLVGGAATRSVWPTGTAVFASQVGQADLRLAGNHVGDSEGAGVFLDAASATLSGNTWSGNTIDLVQQLCDGTTPTPAGLSGEPLTTVDLCPPYDLPVESFTYSTEYAPPELGD